MNLTHLQKNSFTASLNFSLSVHWLSKITGDGLPRPVQRFVIYESFVGS